MTTPNVSERKEVNIRVSELVKEPSGEMIVVFGEICVNRMRRSALRPSLMGGI